MGRVSIGGLAAIKSGINALAAESGSGVRLRGNYTYACESEEDAAALIADANIDSAEIAETQADIGNTMQLGEQAEVAADGFELAAVAQPENQESATIMTAQADTVAQDVADTMGVDVGELLPEIPDTDRTAVATESGARTFKKVAMYGTVSRSPEKLRLCSESMWNTAKSAFGSVWEKLLKMLRQIAQWVDKYIGTFPRLLKSIQAMKARAKGLDGKRKKQAKLTIESNVKMLSYPAVGGSSEIKYVTDTKEMINGLSFFAGGFEAMVDSQKKDNDQMGEFIQALNSADFSDEASAKASVDAILSETIDATPAGATDITSKKYKDRAGVKVYEVLNLPGYTRVIYTTFEGGKPGSMDELSSHYSIAGFEFVNGDPESKKEVKPSLSFEVMTQGQIEDVCDTMKKGVDEIITWRSGKSWLKSEENIRKMKQAVEKMKTKGTKAGDSDDASRQSREATKAAIEIANHNVRMTAFPTKMIERYKAFVDTCLGICNKSIGEYESNS